MTDDLDVLRDRLLRFVADREWEHFHTPKNLAMALDIDLVANAHHKLDEVEVRYPPGE